MASVDLYFKVWCSGHEVGVVVVGITVDALFAGWDKAGVNHYTGHGFRMNSRASRLSLVMAWITSSGALVSLAKWPILM